MRTLEELKEEDSLIYFLVSDEFETKNPARVYSPSRGIEVNKKVFNKLPKAQQYFIVKWCYHKIPNSGAAGDLAADYLAMKDYILKGFSKKRLISWFPKMFKPSHYARKRIGSLYKNIKNESF